MQPSYQRRTMQPLTLFVESAFIAQKRLHLKGTMTGTGYTSFTTFFSFYLPTSTLPYHPTTHKPPKTLLTPYRNTHLTPKFLDKMNSLSACERDWPFFPLGVLCGVGSAAKEATARLAVCNAQQRKKRIFNLFVMEATARLAACSLVDAPNPPLAADGGPKRLKPPDLGTTLRKLGFGNKGAVKKLLKEAVITVDGEPESKFSTHLTAASVVAVDGKVVLQPAQPVPLLAVYFKVKPPITRS